MINGNVQDFMSKLMYGEEMWIVYNDKKYFIQGYVEEEIYYLEISLEYNEDDFYVQFSSEKPNICVEKFISAELFEGKKFWDVEKEIEWVD